MNAIQCLFAWIWLSGIDTKSVPLWKVLVLYPVMFALEYLTFMGFE